MKHVDWLSKGLECLGSDNAAAMLLDLNLPDAAGLDLIEKIQEPARDVPIVVLTGHEDDELGIKVVLNGAQDYFVNDRVTGSLLRHSVRYAIERKKLLSQLEHSTKEFITLRGLKPICANCKKIRDGKGCWTQIETYISAQTPVVFADGICPECADKLYEKLFGGKV